MMTEGKMQSIFEEAFYEKKNLDPQMHVQQENNNATVADEVDPELFGKSVGKSRDAGVTQFTGEDDEVMKNSEKIV